MTADDEQQRDDGAPVKILSDILTVQRRMAWATVVLYFLVAVLGAIAWVYVTQLATTNQNALCAFQADVQQRAEVSIQFLDDHPNGIPGISPAMMRQNLKAQRQTVEALSILGCDTEG